MPNKSLWDSITGKRHGDINLPNDSGKVDARLSDPAEQVKSLTSNSALQALKNFGLAASDKAKRK